MWLIGEKVRGRWGSSQECENWSLPIAGMAPGMPFEGIFEGEDSYTCNDEQEYPCVVVRAAFPPTQYPGSWYLPVGWLLPMAPTVVMEFPTEVEE